MEHRTDHFKGFDVTRKVSMRCYPWKEHPVQGLEHLEGMWHIQEKDPETESKICFFHYFHLNSHGPWIIVSLQHQKTIECY